MKHIFSSHDRTIKLAFEMLCKVKGDTEAGTFTCDDLAQFIETAFWSSLRSYEGRLTRLSVILAPPDNFTCNVSFSVALDYTEENLVRLAPAVPRSGVLCVNCSDSVLSIWGFSHVKTICDDAILIEISEPGVVKLSIGEYQPFAILDGRYNPVIAGTRSYLADYISKLLYEEPISKKSLESRIIVQESMALVALARSILADGHGGTLLIVPNSEGAWRDSLNPFNYRYLTPDTSIHDQIRSKFEEIHSRVSAIKQVQESAISGELKKHIVKVLSQISYDMSSTIKAVSSLSGFDGAIVISRDCNVIGFGAKISIVSDVTPHVCIFKPEPGSQKVTASPLEQIGGTRHQSAARFVASNRDCIALVISQDRHLSVVHWHDSIQSVAVIRNGEWWL